MKGRDGFAGAKPDGDVRGRARFIRLPYPTSLGASPGPVSLPMNGREATCPA